MTFFDWLSANPGWALLYLLVIVTAFPTMSFRWHPSEKKAAEKDATK